MRFASNMEGGKQKTKRPNRRVSEPASENLKYDSEAAKVPQAGDSGPQSQKGSDKKKAKRQLASGEGQSASGGGHEVAQSSGQEERMDSKVETEAGAREPEGAAGEPMVKAGKRKAGDEIDSIFGTAKKKGVVSKDETGAVTAGTKAKASNRLKDRIGGAKVGQKLSQKPKAVKLPGARKRTNDGLTVYAEEELGFGRKDAGGTPLCPFDCQCCF